jgi:periplasmic protein TonB
MAFGMITSSGTPLGRAPGPSGQEPGFFARNRAAIIAGIVALIVLGVVVSFLRTTVTAPPVKQVETVTIVPVQPPKPPPPPPPVQQQMIQQPKITMPLQKPTEQASPTKVATPKAAAPPLGTAIKGSTPNNFDLSGSGSGDGLLDGGGGGGSGAWSYYASQLQGQINTALQKNPHTSHASFQVTARIWLDAKGVVTSVVLSSSSGNPQIDQAIRTQALATLNAGAPPAGMPMPINISLTGEQPM